MRGDAVDCVDLLRKLHAIVFFIVIRVTPIVRRIKGLARGGVVVPICLELAKTIVVEITVLRISCRFHI